AAIAPTEKKAGEGGAFPQSEWQEGALGLLLLAAAELTALLSPLQTALPPSLLDFTSITASCPLSACNLAPSVIDPPLVFKPWDCGEPGICVATPAKLWHY